MGRVIFRNAFLNQKTPIAKEYHDSAPDAESEKQVTQRQREIILQALKDKKPVIVDDTNLSSVTTTRFRSLVGKNVTIGHVYFDLPYSECLKRNNNRERKVPEQVLQSMSKSRRKSGHLKRIYEEENGQYIAE